MIASGSRACFATTIVAKKKSILLGKGGFGSFSYRRRFLSSPFKAFKEEEDMSSSQQQQQEEEHKVTPEFPKGEEYPSGRDEDATTTTQSSFAAWEFAQGPFHGKKGFLVTSLAPGSVRVLLFFFVSIKLFCTGYPRGERGCKSAQRYVLFNVVQRASHPRRETI